MAASIAEPPPFITSSAIWVASGCEVAAIACGAMTSERVANSWPVMRSAANAVTDTVDRASNNALRSMAGNQQGNGGTIAQPPR
ncbi:hypothetical protein D3C71_2087040 [compost metagenome]